MARRWLFPVLMLLCSMLSYLDRNVLAVLSPTLLPALALSAEQYGWVISGFSWAYTIGNPIWGKLVDRWGVRAAMLAAVTLWSGASAAHALVGGFLGLLLCRIALGFGEGATFPGGFATVALALPERERSRGIAVAYSGGSLGAIIAPLVLVPIGAIFGWRGAFWLTGAAGAFWLAAWFVLSRPLASRERGHAARLRPARLDDSRIWAGVLGYCLGAYPLATGLYITPLLFSRVFGVSQLDLAKYLWIPPLGWEVGYLALGWLLDRAVRTDRAFRLFFVALLALVVPFAFASSVSSLGVALALIFAGMFAAAGFVIGTLNYLARVFGPSEAGWTAGLCAGAWSAGVGLTMPLLGRLVDAGLYRELFALVAAVPFLGVLMWWSLDKISKK